MNKYFLLLISVLVFEFSSRASLSLSGSSTVVCAEGSGSVTLTATGGIAPYQYKIQGGIYQASNVFTNLSAGTFTFYVEDNTGAFDSVAETVSQTVHITGTILADTQHISTSVSGGTPPYQYFWPGYYSDAFVDSNYIESYPYSDTFFPGHYYVAVKDQNGCMASDSFTVFGDQSVGFTTKIVSHSCYTLDDDSLLIVGYGSDNGNYAIHIGTPFGNFTSYNEYFITSSGADGPGFNFATVQGYQYPITYNYSSYFRVYKPSPLALTAGISNALGAGQNNGAISLSVTGGQPGYSFAWGPELPNSPNLTGVSPGTYSVTVTDGVGCSITGTYVVGPPTLYESSTNEQCYDGATAHIVLDVAGAYQPYQFEEAGGSYQAGDTFNNLVAGAYNFYVKDSTGAMDSIAVVITQPQAIFIQATITNADTGVNNGFIYLNVNGGTSPYTYVWDTYTTGTYEYGSLAPGTYYVLVTDAHGCTEADTFVVGLGPAAIAGLAPNNAVEIYPNPSNGSFTLSPVTVGQTYIIYDISGRVINSGRVTSTQQNIQLKNAPAGTYTLELKGSAGSAGMVRFTVE